MWAGVTNSILTPSLPKNQLKNYSISYYWIYEALLWIRRSHELCIYLVQLSTVFIASSLVIALFILNLGNILNTELTASGLFPRNIMSTHTPDMPHSNPLLLIKCIILNLIFKIKNSDKKIMEDYLGQFGGDFYLLITEITCAPPSERKKN